MEYTRAAIQKRMPNKSDSIAAASQPCIEKEKSAASLRIQSYRLVFRDKTAGRSFNEIIKKVDMKMRKKDFDDITQW